MVTEQLRNVLFRPYRKGMGPTFRLVTWDTGRTDSLGKSMLGYRLTMTGDTRTIVQSGDNRVVLFEGEDFGCSPLHPIDSDEAVAAIMGFLTLKPGDTDRDYFADYTDTQLAFCSEHAEALANCVADRFGDDA